MLVESPEIDVSMVSKVREIISALRQQRPYPEEYNGRIYMVVDGDTLGIPETKNVKFLFGKKNVNGKMSGHASYNRVIFNVLDDNNDAPKLLFYGTAYGIVLHELIHLLDLKRIPIKLRHYKGIPFRHIKHYPIYYYNNPLELNAFYHMIVSKLISFIEAVRLDPSRRERLMRVYNIAPSFQETIKNLMPSEQPDHIKRFLANITKPNQKKMLRRLYKLYTYAMNEQTDDIEFVTESVNVKSKDFMKWFAGSKVVDEFGNPQLMYHGTINQHDKVVKGIRRFYPLSHFGSVRAANKRIKDVISDLKINRIDNNFSRSIYPVYLNIKNPLRISDRVDTSHDPLSLLRYLAFGTFDKVRSENMRYRKKRYGKISLEQYYRIDRNFLENTIKAKVIELLRRKGYDGLVYKNALEDRGRDSWVIFSPHQVWPLFADKPD